MHQIACRLGLCPRPYWESLQITALLQTPLAVFMGPAFGGKEGREGVGQKSGWEGAEGKKGKGRGKDPMTLRHGAPMS